MANTFWWSVLGNCQRCLRVLKISSIRGWSNRLQCVTFLKYSLQQDRSKRNTLKEKTNKRNPSLHNVSGDFKNPTRFSKIMLKKITRNRKRISKDFFHMCKSLQTVTRVVNKICKTATKPIISPKRIWSMVFQRIAYQRRICHNFETKVQTESNTININPKLTHWLDVKPKGID